MSEAPIEILVVEDVEPMLALLKMVLEGIQGVAVTALAKNGWEARLELDRNRPGLVLLDEILPGESSLDLLNEIRSRKIPVICLTSMENPVHAVPSGALGRIQKPNWKTMERDRERMAREIQVCLRRET